MAQTEAEIRKQQIESEHNTDMMNRVVAVLSSMDCKFKIIAADGAEYGDLEVAKAKSCTRTRLHNFVKDTDYIRTIESIRDGRSRTGMAVIPSDRVHDLVYIENLHTSIKLACKKRIGEGKFETLIKSSEDGLEKWIEIKKTDGLPPKT